MKFLKPTQKMDIAETEKKVTEKEILALIKTELPYNSVEIKKRGSKGFKW